MELNIFTIVENFLSDYQKNDKNFVNLMNILIQSLQMKTYKNVSISPLNFSLNMDKIKNIFEMKHDDVYIDFKLLLPFADKQLIDEITDKIPIQTLVLLLKQLYTIKGSDSYLRLWNNIVGDISYSSLDKTATDSTTINNLNQLTQLNVNLDTNTISSSDNNIVPNVVFIDNIEDINFTDLNLYLQFIQEVKNLNTLFVVLISSTFVEPKHYQLNGNIGYLSEDVISCGRYNNNFFKPFIRSYNNIPNKTVLDCNRENLNNFYTYDDIHNIQFGKIKDEGNISLFTYKSDDGVTYSVLNERNISHIKDNLGFNLIQPYEILNPNSETNLFNLHKQPVQHQSVIELEFALTTYILVGNDYVQTENKLVIL